MSDPRMAELVWRLVDAVPAEIAGNENLLLTLQCGGKEFVVSVTGAKPLMMHDAINALRAAAAHMLSMAGAPLPPDTRKPEPGELDAPQTCQ